ncbi:cytochrome P450 [Frankia sp. CNm7]|uniref:Cytochrome P450 n=1 Tax=Frankia nepalensis TaxID=1836974 RepID=A0A937RRF3_9ACTN|nr:cytochrome P450 [Frankia nepalensis]MBL7498877.1 cytochrome P450 [Frankia nepalensis]MBL7512552.1 cytochrome P450 [Frankia nepalensis]MBL7522403.1 cytochrome P450 [Frankia nepalensis]MBL7631343.1 cytochrome P450 [Frankia nepalensis]
MTTTNENATTTGGEVYYDPYDAVIDVDPYPTWRRLRDEAPLYYNEKFDFYALSRFDDVEAGLADWQTYRSGRGSVLELIKANITLPPGNILFEDPPVHTVHRKILSQVFTPKKMLALEPKVREFCARSLDPLVGSGRFDFIRDLGAQMPMRTIGYLLGIPESDQEAIRDRIDEGLRLEGDGTDLVPEVDYTAGAEMYGDYIDWRAQHPSDDLMTELLTTEFEDETGTRRTLTRTEILTYIMLLAGAGNETTTRLIGWTGKVLAENPDQRRELVADRSLIPNAIEELLRYEAPSPVQARWVARDVTHHGRTVPQGSIMVFLNGSGNRDERRYPDPDRFDIHRDVGRHLTFGYGIHHCLGAALARLEGRVALDEVLARFPEWDVDWTGAVQARTSTVRGWETLPVAIPTS